MVGAVIFVHFRVGNFAVKTRSGPVIAADTTIRLFTVYLCVKIMKRVWLVWPSIVVAGIVIVSATLVIIVIRNRKSMIDKRYNYFFIEVERVLITRFGNVVL
jgi:hypothetical protein